MSVSRGKLLVLGAAAVALAGAALATTATAGQPVASAQAGLSTTAEQMAQPAGSPAPKPSAKPNNPDKPDKPAAKSKTRYVVAAMGDSLTDPRSKGGRYLEYLRAQCPKSRFDSYGVGGNMVNQMRRRFLRDIYGEPDPRTPKRARKKQKRPQYTHVMVLGGINDICSDESAHRTNPKIKKDLAAMYAMARARGAKVIALTMPPWAGFTRYYNRRRANSTFEVNAWIRQRHKAGEVDALLDVYPIMSCGQEEFLCEKYGWSDKVHWNKAGHKVVGKALHEQLFSDCE